MPRQSQQEELTMALRVYLATAEKHSPGEYPLDGRSVAKALGVSPTTLYKYRLQEPIRAAAHRQRENAKIARKKPSLNSPKERLQKLGEELSLPRFGGVEKHGLYSTEGGEYGKAIEDLHQGVQT